jgi:hypothetical protein
MVVARNAERNGLCMVFPSYEAMRRVFFLTSRDASMAEPYRSATLQIEIFREKFRQPRGRADCWHRLGLSQPAPTPPR